MGGFTVACAVFIIFFVKETKGKSLNERKSLYIKVDDVVIDGRNDLRWKSKQMEMVPIETEINSTQDGQSDS